jgi:hypothetical protein
MAATDTPRIAAMRAELHAKVVRNYGYLLALYM